MEAVGYYSRERIEHLDGTAIFQNETDRANENEVASVLEKAWTCSIRPFGMLSAIDWYAERRGRLIGVLELKSRTHDSHKYPTVFLNVRKWLALSLASVGLGCPAVFAIRFTDGVFWAPLQEIDASDNRVGGCRVIVKSSNDIEPIIEVHTSILRQVVN